VQTIAPSPKRRRPRQTIPTRPESIEERFVACELTQGKPVAKSGRDRVRARKRCGTRLARVLKTQHGDVCAVHPPIDIGGIGLPDDRSFTSAANASLLYGPRVLATDSHNCCTQTFDRRRPRWIENPNLSHYAIVPRVGHEGQRQAAALVQ
jgi:hypothetical protein